MLAMVDKRDYVDLSSFCLTERDNQEDTAYNVCDRFGWTRAALFAYHLAKCSSKLRVLAPSSSRVHPPLCPQFHAISEFLRIFIDQLEIDWSL